MAEGPNRNVLFTSLTQFGMAFSGTFVTVFMPFYLLKVSPYSERETLLWIGLIMGVNHIVSAFASYFWGLSTSRFNPKSLYLRALIAHAVLYCSTGFTENIHIIFFLRLMQGVFGGISTIGLLLISSSSSPKKVTADIGLFQTLMTLGTLIGSPVGAFAASLLGYKAAFVCASAFLLSVSIFFYFFVTEVPLQPKKERVFGSSGINRNTILAWMLCFTAMVQLMFLPSILPSIFETFQMERAVALNWAGVVTMFYTATSTLGTYVWTRLSAKIGRDRMILGLGILGALSLASLSLSREVIGFTVIRMVQTGFIGAVLPLVISIFAEQPKGGVIGFLNSSRFVAHALGPILATSILAYSNLTVLYLSIGSIMLLALLGFRLFFKNGNGFGSEIAK